MAILFNGPFSDDFLNGDGKFEVDFEYDGRDIEKKREIAAMMFEDMLDREKGNIVAPDTTGVDYFLLKDFMTDDMAADFAIIEQDFLKNCRAKLEEFNQVGWYGEGSFRINNPRDAMNANILRLIYNGAKAGDDYCVELIKNLYKVYHKKEYNKLKRFHTISPDEIFSLSENEYTDSDYRTVGRIMGMCPFFGVELHENCSFMFRLLEKKRNEILDYEEGEYDYPDFDEEQFAECAEQVDKWFEEQKKAGVSFKKQEPKYWELFEFQGQCFRRNGYVEDYAHMCMDNNMGLRMQMIRTLSVLKNWKPNKEFTFEEVQVMTTIYDLVSAVSDVADFCDYEVGYLFGDEIDEVDLEEALFNPANMNVNKTRKKEDKKPVTNVAPVSKGDISEKDYLEEISQLRSRLNEKEQENKYLREQYRAAKKSAEEAESLSKKFDEERDELIALRNYAYKSEHDDETVDEDKLPDMKEAVASKKIVIIGGHENWQNKLKQLFPDWMFVHPDAFKNVTGAMLEEKERVYFFTDYINHTSYKKFINIIREKEIPFGYIGSRNVDNVIRQVYEDACV